MFNQPSAGAGHQEMTFLPVVLTLVNGESVKGAIAMRKNGRLGEVLNGPDRFFLFKTAQGEPVYLSRNSVAAVQSNQIPMAGQLRAAMEKYEANTPYAILGVEPGIDRDGLREAYHRLVKQYHPDHFAGITLPPEIREYLDSIIQRLNAACQQIMDDIERREQESLARREEMAKQQSPIGTIRYFGQ